VKARLDREKWCPKKGLKELEVPEKELGCYILSNQ
jgi:hypothetical protein